MGCGALSYWGSITKALPMQVRSPGVTSPCTRNPPPCALHACVEGERHPECTRAYWAYAMLLEAVMSTVRSTLS
jgi:hypothetical protein